MVIGAPNAQYVQASYFWQIYEVTGLGVADTPVITKVPNQPAGFNNVAPLYGTDERILFTSDRPRNGAAHLYPQLDEYEEAPTVTGLWSLEPGDGRPPDAEPLAERRLLADDRQLRARRSSRAGTTCSATSRPTATARPARSTSRAPTARSTTPTRSPGAAQLSNAGGDLSRAARRARRPPRRDEPPGPLAQPLLPVADQRGRHRGRDAEPHRPARAARLLQPRLRRRRQRRRVHLGDVGARQPEPVRNFLEIKEDPATPGRFFGIDAPEFETHAGGQIVRMDLPPGAHPDQMTVVYVTNRATANPRLDTDPVPAGHSGFYRNPLPLSNGTLLAVHTSETRADANDGHCGSAGVALRLPDQVARAGGRRDVSSADQTLTTGIIKSVSYWDPDARVTYTNVTLWELDPVEVRARAKPVAAAPPLPGPEASIFTQEGVDPASFKAWLAQRNLALIVSRNVTTRDALDKQQPFNLRIAGTAHQTVAHGRQDLRRRAPADLPGRPDPRRGRHGEPAGRAPRARAGAARPVRVRTRRTPAARPAACGSGPTARWRPSCRRTARSPGR